MSWAVCIGLAERPGERSRRRLSCRRSRLSSTRSTWTTATHSSRPAIPWRQAERNRPVGHKRETHAARCELSAALVAEKPTDPAGVVLNRRREQAALQTHSRRGRGQGSHTPEQKEGLQAFSEGNERIIVTKPKIAGMGLNWQHCADMVYCSTTFSLKYFYQGLRRIYRFRQAPGQSPPRGDRRDGRERHRGGRPGNSSTARCTRRLAPRCAVSVRSMRIGALRWVSRGRWLCPSG